MPDTPGDHFVRTTAPGSEDDLDSPLAASLRQGVRPAGIEDDADRLASSRLVRHEQTDQLLFVVRILQRDLRQPADMRLR